MNEFTVIGFDTREPKGGLPLFKVMTYGKSAEEVADVIAANVAWRSTHVIYTIVPTTDLWW